MGGGTGQKVICRSGKPQYKQAAMDCLKVELRGKNSARGKIRPQSVGTEWLSWFIFWVCFRLEKP